MFRTRCCVVAGLLVSPVAHAAEPGTVPVPKAVLALDGCWQGGGEVMGKAVTMAITAKPIVQNAMFAVDTDSRAVADPADRYSAHLIFGGIDKPPGITADPIVGFWADSFGGAFTATGRGESHEGGFAVTYHYPDAAFVNRWRLAGDRVTWRIIARDEKGAEKLFASYSLRRTACRSSREPR